MAPRAVWRGFLKVAELNCAVALYTAVSTSQRIAFHTLNRETGHRVRRQFVDGETGEPVESGDQVKGYQTGPDDYVVLEPEEVAAAVPHGDKTLSVDTFLRCGDIDDAYFDRPYYLAPGDREAEEAYALIREGMRSKNVAALARTVLFRRVRTVLVRAHGRGLIATTLNFDYEVKPASEAFDDVPEMKIEGEMLDLAEHIIETKSGSFDPSAFEDRYEAALAELVAAKREGRSIPRREERRAENVVDLMAALRESAGRGGKKAATGARKTAKSGAKKAGATKAGAKKATAAAPARRKRA